MEKTVFDTTQQAPANGVATYRTRPIEIQAIRWLGEPNCEQVFAFIGWEHPDDETDHTLICGLGLDGKQEAEIGDWIVRDEDGVYEVFVDRAFHAEFEPAADPETFTWGEGLAIEDGHVTIPVNRGDTHIGDMKLALKDAWLLSDMLADALDQDAMQQRAGLERCRD